MRTLLWVDTPAQLRELVEQASSFETIAFDAEMDSYYSYHTKLCLVQISFGEVDALVDSLALSDLSPLNALTDEPKYTKVFHAADNDVPYFRRHGVTFQNIFDTHHAAKVLELPTKSYGGLVEQYLNLTLAKDQARADWRLRPLPDEQVEYARQDTRYLLPLVEILDKELDEQEARAEAESGFRDLEHLKLREKVFEPKSWAKIKGAKELSGIQRSILEELFLWREKIAEEADLAVFRVAPNGALISLSRKRFTKSRELKAWAKNNFFKERADELIDLLEKGRSRGPIPLPDLRKKKPEDWTPAQEKLFDKLRVWRNEESERRGVDPSRVFSNRQLKNLARKHPTCRDTLRSVEGLDNWKLQEYGEKMLELLGAN